MTPGPLYRVLDWLPDSGLGAGERLVAIAIAKHMSPEGIAWPSQRRLAAWSGLSERRVRYAIAKLTAPDGVFDEQTGGSLRGEHRQTSRYRLRTEALCAAVPRHPMPRSTEAPRAGGPRHHVPPKSPVKSPIPDAPRRVAARRVLRNEGRRKEGTSDPWSREASEDWLARWPGGTAPGGRIGSALKPLVTAHGWPEVRRAWQGYLAETEARFASPQRFAATFADWRPRRAPAPAPEVLTGPDGEPLQRGGS